MASQRESERQLNHAPPKPEVLPISLFAETPQSEQKQLSKNYAPFGRLIPCELIVTVDSSGIQTPIIGLVTEDIYHNGRLIIPAGTEVHGKAQTDRSRERIASGNNWTLVWSSGEELRLSGIALDREADPGGDGWGITDGSAGLRAGKQFYIYVTQTIDESDAVIGGTRLMQNDFQFETNQPTASSRRNFPPDAAAYRNGTMP